jgi:L-alanine-DL-glutamate epimerase-like enolase superfamily enzyme
MSNRRNFFFNLAALGTVALAPSLSFSQAKSKSTSFKNSILISDFEKMFPEPILIKSIDLLKFDGEYLLRVTSGNGHTGITLCNQRMPHLVSLLHGLIIPNMIGKDARNIEALIDEVYIANSNYKYAGMPFWNCFGHVEIAIFDMLGRVAGKPVNQLLGKPVKSEIEVYLSSTTRETTPQQEADFFVRRLKETGAKAVKFKV